MISMLSMIIFYLIVVPVSVFLHELGHALAAIGLTRKTVLMYVGSDQPGPKPTLVLGRLQLCLSWGLTGSVATADDDEPLSKVQRIGIPLGGPLVSLLLVMAMLVIYLCVPMQPLFENLVFASGVFNLINLCVTLTPVVYSAGPYAGRPSDGYRVLAAMGKRPPEPRA